MKKLIICIFVIRICAFGFEASSDLDLLPQDIAGVFCAELKQVSDLRFVEDLRGKASHFTSVFKEMTDIEIKNIVSVTCAISYPSGNVPEDKNQIKEYTILHGDFDSDAIYSQLNRSKKKSFKITKHQNMSVIYTGSGSHAFCFLDRTHLAAGNLACIKDIIDVKKNNTRSAERARNTALVKLPEDKRTFMWGMYHAPDSGRDSRRPREIGEQIQTCTNFGYEANIETVHFKNRDPIDYVNFTVIAKYNDIDIPGKVASGIRQLKNQTENLKRYAQTHGINLGRHKIGFFFLDSMNVTNKGNILLFKFRCQKSQLRSYFHGSYMEGLLEIINEGLKENTNLQVKVIQDEEAF